MTIVDQIARLQEERRVAVAAVEATKAEIRQVKDKHLNAQNIKHQQRIDAEHRMCVAKLNLQQDALTLINTRLKLLQSKKRSEYSMSRRQEVSNVDL